MCDKSSDTIKGIHVHGDILIPLLIYMCDNNSDPLTITLILVLLTSDKYFYRDLYVQHYFSYSFTICIY